MSLIICPECGKNFSDKAPACPNCGYPTNLINSDNSEENNIIEDTIKEDTPTTDSVTSNIIQGEYSTSQTNSQPNTSKAKTKSKKEVNIDPNNIQQVSAKKELDDLKRKGVGLYIFASVLFAALAISLFSSPGALFCLIICIICISATVKRLKRIKELQKIVNGHNRILICPYCKSPDISSSVVQTGITTGPQKSRVSVNLNPLHPFTHTNIKTSATNSYLDYGSKFQCNSCGKIFDTPGEYWQ